ncbi:MAG: hypothetical protein IT479_00565 [Xanthomonadales bacterium]|nr:hypothetical protein [Xanthomonadales bacterium]
MSHHSRRFVCGSSLALALAVAATGTASAQSCGTGGCAFWATEVNDSWFNPFRWGGILPWQGGVPNSSVSCRIELAVQVDVLGQGQGASCHHLQFNHTGAVVRVAGSSFRAELNVHGTQMDNNGLILIGGQDALQDSSLIIHNHTNANGADGRIRLSAPPNHGAFLSPYSNTGYLLVNWPSHTIEGNGTIRVRLQNDGLVDANVAGRTLTFESPHNIDNNNLVRARTGGTLTLSMGNGDHGFRQFGQGRIVIENGSALALVGAGDQGLSGGRLQTIGSGVVTVFTQGFPIQDIHFEAGSRMTFSGNSGIYVGPLGIENDGLIHTGPSGFIASRFGESTTLTGSGRVQLEGGALSALFGGGGFAMVNGPEHTIGGFGTIALALTNQGELLADRNGLTTGPGQLTLQTSAQANHGTMVARGGGSLHLSATTLTQNAQGLVRAEQDSAFVLEGNGPVVVGGTLATSGNGVIYPNTSSGRLENLTLASGSQVLVPCSRELTLVGAINNRGTITLDNAGCGPNSATLRGSGATTLGQAGEVRLRADGPSVNVTLEGPGGLLTLGSGQVLTGSGRISGGVRVDGAVSPDQPFAPVGPVGALTLAGGSTLTLGNSAELVFDIAGPASFDVIQGGGSVQLGGRLLIVATGGYVPALGSSFDLVVSGSVSGSLSGVDLPPEWAALDARVEVLADRLRLHIVAPLMVDGFESP